MPGWLDDLCTNYFKGVERRVTALNALVDGRQPTFDCFSPAPSVPPSVPPPAPAGPRCPTSGAPSADASPAPAAAVTAPQSGGGQAAATPTLPASVSEQKLPKDLTTVDQVIEAWEAGVDGLLPMKVFVGNKHPTLKLDRRERKQLCDHLCIARNVRSIGRDEFRQRYETDGVGGRRSLRAIRTMLQKEGSGKK